VPELLTRFKKFGTRETLELEACETPESGTCTDRESRSCGILESGTRGDLESGICEVRESVEAQIRRLQCTRIFMYKGFMNQEEAKSKTSHLKSGFNV
jgi:hypothetical protein